VKTRRRGTGPLDALAGALTEAAEAVRDAPTEGSRVDVTGRTNIQVAKNVGRDGATAHASATQDAPIVRTGEPRSGSGTI